jgi:hypothetical protein
MLMLSSAQWLCSSWKEQLHTPHWTPGLALWLTGRSPPFWMGLGFIVAKKLENMTFI